MRSSCLVLLLVGASSVASQTRAASDSVRSPEVLLVEHRWRAGSVDSVVVFLKRDGVYRAEILGSVASLTAIPASPPRYPAFVPRVGTTEAPEVFELHPARTGKHVLRLAGFPGGSEALLRIYSNDAEARVLVQQKDREWGIGLGLTAGHHSGYRVQATSPDSPGGSDVEGYVILDSGRGVSGCFGAGYQSLSEIGYGVAWAFAEARAQIFGRTFLGHELTQVGLSLRIAQGGITGSRSIDPSLLAAGIILTQHLTPGGRARGWSLQASFQHGWLGHMPELDHRQFSRLAGGLAWVP
jgi:hypothetical protein